MSQYYSIDDVVMPTSSNLTAEGFVMEENEGGDGHELLLGTPLLPSQRPAIVAPASSSYDGGDLYNDDDGYSDRYDHIDGTYGSTRPTISSSLSSSGMLGDEAGLNRGGDAGSSGSGGWQFKKKRGGGGSWLSLSSVVSLNTMMKGYRAGGRNGGGRGGGSKPRRPPSLRLITIGM